MKVLFVCMGNICRSPTAEAVFAHYVKEAGLENVIGTDSAGTHAYHVGEPPDLRAQKTSLARGINIDHLRARRAVAEDFEQFDLVLAMDNDNYQHLLEICPQHTRHKLKLFMSYAAHLNIEEVPDPYYGGAQGFERVLDMIEEASKGLLGEIQKGLR